MDSPAVKDHFNGSPSTVRRERSNSLVTVPSSLTSTPKKDPQSGKIPRKRSASFSGPRMSAAQPGVLLPNRKSPPAYVLPSVCTQKTKDLTGQKPKEAKSDVDFTGQKVMAPKGVKTDVMSPVKTMPRSPSQTKERQEKQSASGPVMVKPVASSSTPKPLPPLPPQSQRPAKSNSPVSLAASGSIKMGALRRVSDSSSCGSGRPSPALPRKENSGVQNGLN